MSKIVVANLKMNFVASEIDDYLSTLIKYVNSNNVIICPTAIYIAYFLKKKFKVCIQNISEYDNGAYTGEISAKQASSLGINYTLIGHSERRQHYNESNTIVSRKIKQALKNKLKVILCIGETLNERELLKTDKVLKQQINTALKGININDIENIIIAYEPVWAIGTSSVCSNKDIITTVNYIKSLIKENYKIDINILYGGSVNDENIKTLNKIKEVDGFLVGGASLNTNKILKIIKEVI